MYECSLTNIMMVIFVVTGIALVEHLHVDAFTGICIDQKILPSIINLCCSKLEYRKVISVKKIYIRCCGSVDKTSDSQPSGPQFKSAGNCSSALGQGT